MRVSQSEMEKSHQRIVQGASRLVRERGIENTTVMDVMAEAGLKQGGFYRHFETKDALVDAALQASFDDVLALLESRFTKHEPEAAVASYRANYLSKEHVETRGVGCPVAALGADVARGVATLKASFSAGVNRMISALAEGMPGSQRKRRALAARELAMLVGAVVIARASDGETARAVISACRTPVA